MILVDSTVWIDAIRGLWSEPTMALRHVLQLRQPIFATHVIVQEVLQGARDEMQFRRWRKAMETIPNLAPSDALRSHQAAAELYARARWQGITIASGNDCLIAAVAVEHGAMVLTRDGDFQRLARIEPRLRLAP